jgi:FXSXX-COOH protein
MAFYDLSNKVAPITPGDEMSLHKQELNSVIPDLRDLPLERLAELGDSVLAHSIALYRQRLKETGVPLSSFNARI